MHAIKRHLVLSGTLVAALAVATSSAYGETSSATYAVGGPVDCGPPGETYEVPLPARAIDIEASPPEGHTFDRNGSAVAEVDSVVARNGTEAVEWTVVPLECDFAPWSVGPQTFTATFDTLSRRPRLKAGEAKRVAIRVITSRLNINWTSADSMRCSKRAGKNTRKCKFKLLFASAVMSGKAKVALFSKPSTKLYARVRYRAAVPAPYNQRIRGKKRVSLGRY